jgi:hypothetical protein
MAQCQQAGGHVDPGTRWCRSDGVIWICKTDGKWARTGEKCTMPSQADGEANKLAPAPDAEESDD